MWPHRSNAPFLLFRWLGWEGMSWKDRDGSIATPLRLYCTWTYYNVCICVCLVEEGEREREEEQKRAATELLFGPQFFDHDIVVVSISIIRAVVIVIVMVLLVWMCRCGVGITWEFVMGTVRSTVLDNKLDTLPPTLFVCVGMDAAAAVNSLLSPHPFVCNDTFFFFDVVVVSVLVDMLVVVVSCIRVVACAGALLGVFCSPRCCSSLSKTSIYSNVLDDLDSLHPRIFCTVIIMIRSMLCIGPSNFPLFLFYRSVCLLPAVLSIHDSVPDWIGTCPQWYTSQIALSTTQCIRIHRQQILVCWWIIQHNITPAWGTYCCKSNQTPRSVFFTVTEEVGIVLLVSSGTTIVLVKGLVCVRTTTDPVLVKNEVTYPATHIPCLLILVPASRDPLFLW